MLSGKLPLESAGPLFHGTGSPLPEEVDPLGLRALRELRGLEGISCDVPLSPGDIVFFREVRAAHGAQHDS